MKVAAAVCTQFLVGILINVLKETRFAIAVKFLFLPSRQSLFGVDDWLPVESRRKTVFLRECLDDLHVAGVHIQNRVRKLRVALFRCFTLAGGDQPAHGAIEREFLDDLAAPV